MSETSPATSSEKRGYKATRFNALRHGLLSRYTVLPWEDEEEYREIVDALKAEHKPEGPTEEHLVEEIGGIIWRKRRLRLAEASEYRHGLKSAISSGQETIGAALAHLDLQKEPASATAMNIKEFEERETQIVRALALLRTNKAGAYEKALSLLSEETSKWWERCLEAKPITALLTFDNSEPQYAANARDLLVFLLREAMPSCVAQRNKLLNRSQIREQMIGEALNADKMEALARYEAHLDRKLERTLGVLIRLRELRAAPE